jgi:excisionase family DNA binding protein
MEKEILTIDEAAELLKFSKRSVNKLAKDNKIPARKVLNKWRFVKEELIKWVSSEGE